MNANTEREDVGRVVFRNICDNYLYKYLIKRREQAFFVKEVQVENSSYCATLHELKNEYELEVNVKSALDAFEVRIWFFFGAVAFLYYSSESIFGCSCDDLRWKKIFKSDQFLDGNPKFRRGKICYSNRLIGHLSIFGKTLTQYANGIESTNLPTNFHLQLEVQQELPKS
ncbi:unnamed protein product [Rhizophagus irregularis]|uniref:Uncharacterized protein n=1 Tax=Rhizophagus irregularis TaxID=588596 RepID=A0A916EEP4_9GLOM|nr:unnamed protein product [Rhizophagus irregularis]